MASTLDSDEALLTSIQGRDMHALEQFYDRHRAVAYALALRVLQNPADAEEVLQEAFLNVWRSAGTYQPGRSSPRSWLLSVVHHRAIDRLRGRQSRPQPAALEHAMELPDSTDTWREVAERLTSDDVKRALGQLPPEQRQAIEMAYFNGYTHAQIAEMTSVPLGTVKGRIRMGLHKLKSLLESTQNGMSVEPYGS